MKLQRPKMDTSLHKDHDHLFQELTTTQKPLTTTKKNENNLNAIATQISVDNDPEIHTTLHEDNDYQFQELKRRRTITTTPKNHWQRPRKSDNEQD